MKIIYFGTPDFAAYNLQSLINDDNYKISAIVSAPDNKKGRGRKFRPTAVKKIALENKITLLQPLNLKETSFIKKLKELNADLFVVIAFRFLPKQVWQIPKNGTINLHASLLPDYRGAAPINRVLINGEKKTGITTFYINQKIDCGEIIQQEKILIGKETTAGQLHDILMKKGYNLLKNTLKLIKNNNAEGIIQTNKSNIKDAPKLTKELFRINWNKSADEIHNLVRGLSPYISSEYSLKNVAICPSAWFILKDIDGNEKRIKLQLTKTNSEKTNYTHLNINTDNKSYLNIAVNGKILSILQLQLEGKKSMNIRQFLQGNKIDNSTEIL